MTFHQVRPDARLEFEALIYENLGIDPAKLAEIDTETHSIAVGLNILMRRTLQKAIGSVSAPNGSVFRLSKDDAAHDLSELFAYALVRAARRVRGLPYMPLCPADDSVAEMPSKQTELWTTAECAAVAKTLLSDGIRETRDARGLEGSQPISVCDLVKQRLGLRPRQLVQSIYSSRRDSTRAFARDPEGQTVTALASFLLHAVESFQAAAAQNIDMISLVIFDPSCGFAGARLGNCSNVLVAGLLAEPESARDIGFFVKTAAPAHPASLN